MVGVQAGYGEPVSWSLSVAPAAERALRGLDPNVRRRIVAAIDALEVDPRPAASTKLVGFSSRWRLRVGDYRILYDLNDRELIIVVVGLGHRREVYR